MPGSRLGSATRSHALVVLALLTGLIGTTACHVDQELNPSGPGTTTSQVIKFENLYAGVLIRIPDAHQEFYLDRNKSQTVEVHSDDGITTFYVEIIRANKGAIDVSKATRWTGYVSVGQHVTIIHISRVDIND